MQSLDTIDGYPAESVWEDYARLRSAPLNLALFRDLESVGGWNSV